MKVLYVEDEPFLAKIVRESLESRGLVVHHLPDGRGAVQACEQFRPDICVLDVLLPFDNGFTVGKAIRGQFPHIPIVFLTAKDQTGDVLEGFASGGNDYVRKPFSMEELIVRMHNLVRLSSSEKTAQGPGEPIALGRFRFCPLRQEIHLDDQVRRLSHRETQLLNLLCQNANQPVLRKLILDTLWGNDSFFNSRNLDVYIARLREYLRDDEQVEIITLKGVGYRLVFG
ncbi:MAG: response regulator transcription factor [Lewinellaceae bacterium]|nr:response regulator transcription factor [Lewinellaceae bacterium]